MADPVQSFDHTLNPLKGWFSEHAVDARGKLHSDVTIDPLYAGRVVHIASLDTDGTPRFKTGVTNRTMAIFLLNSSNSLDVSNPGGDPATYAGGWVGTSPSGWLSGLVAIGGYELESTEFNSALTYLPNETLTATAADTNATTGGRLTNASAVPYTNPVCGVVSLGKRTNSDGKSVLAFWPVYIPVA